ncbi:MAG: cation:proton antiporter [Pseudomonadota bacterium]
MHDSILFLFFLIFSGAALFATAALYARQALLVAYIALGLLLGPAGVNLVPDPALVGDIANVGIIFLLFLLGLNLEPADLGKLFREAVVVTVLSCAGFAVFGFSVGWVFGFSTTDCLLIGAACMFSSTIIGLKLLPTSALHHQRMGEIIVSILLLQDLVAIAILLLLQGLSQPGEPALAVAKLAILLPTLVGAAWFLSRYALHRLIAKFDQIQEYVFLLAVGWCLGMAELATALGLSHEIGAFVAGITLATNPIARFIAESLKPLRDFFLIMFFFALGAGFDLGLIAQIWLPTLVLAGGMLLLKPWVFNVLLRREQEKASLAKEIGVRMGQISEFTLLIAIVGTATGFLSDRAASLVQAATVLSFLVSSYWIVAKYPTPIAVDDALRRD